jgi:hypothetical protein
MLPNISTVRPKGEVAEYTFVRKDSDSTFVSGIALVVYSTADQALRASGYDQHGGVWKRIGTLPSRTMRVHNVLLVMARGIAKQADEAKLTRALSRLGKPVSP